MTVIERKRPRGRLHVRFSQVPMDWFIVHRTAARDGWRVTHRSTSYCAGRGRTQADAIANVEQTMDRLGAERVASAIRKAERATNLNRGGRVSESFRRVAGWLREYHPRKPVITRSPSLEPGDPGYLDSDHTPGCPGLHGLDCTCGTPNFAG